jgi:hypothetical protein
VEAETDPVHWTPGEKLIFLLDHWVDIFDPGSPNGVRGSGWETPHLPEMAHEPSVVELDRTLGVLYVVEKGNYQHLKAHHTAEWRITAVWREFKLPSGRKEKLKVRERQRLAPAWLDYGRVRAGHEFVEHEFQGEPYIPQPLWHALTGTD